VVNRAKVDLLVVRLAKMVQIQVVMRGVVLLAQWVVMLAKLIWIVQMEGIRQLLTVALDA
jgi:hypothetical protein